jgi:hypothetical protein
MDECVEALFKWYQAGMAEYAGPPSIAPDGRPRRRAQDVFAWIVDVYPGITGEMMKAGADRYLPIVEEI